MTLSIPPAGTAIERTPAGVVPTQTAAAPSAAASITADAVAPVAPTPAVAAIGDIKGRGPQQQQAEVQRESEDAHERELATAADEVNQYLTASKRALNFSIDKDSGETVIKVMDTEKNEVIRQIPSEELLALARRLRNGEEGYLVHAQA